MRLSGGISSQPKFFPMIPRAAPQAAGAEWREVSTQMLSVDPGTKADGFRWVEQHLLMQSRVADIKPGVESQGTGLCSLQLQEEPQELVKCVCVWTAADTSCGAARLQISSISLSPRAGAAGKAADSAAAPRMELNPNSACTAPSPATQDGKSLTPQSGNKAEGLASPALPLQPTPINSEHIGLSSPAPPKYITQTKAPGRKSRESGSDFLLLLAYLKSIITIFRGTL
ncbi:hypothetical protein AOLI_G00230350 [Acnodon oligacanthus]